MSAVNITDVKVVLDFEPVVVNRFSGFYVFGRGFLQGFSGLKERPRLILFYSKRFAAQVNEIVRSMAAGEVEQRSTVIKRRWLENYWRYLNIPGLEYFTGSFDIYHCFHHLMPPSAGKIRLMTIHDLRRYKLPELYPHSKLDLFEKAVRKADHFIAISQSTKQDLCSVFGIDEAKVDVVHLAAEVSQEIYSPQAKQKIRVKLQEQLGQELGDYFVAVSSPDSRKNIQMIVEAFDSARRYLPAGTKLLVIGQLPKRQQEFVDRLRQNYYSDVICTGAVDNLWHWLSCAKGLVFASLYEGFGIPILEAFSAGTAVIASNCSSMPEVAAEAAIYVDPYDRQSIAEAMVKVANDEQLRQKLISAGSERVKQFSWQKTAEGIVNVYRKLLAV